MNFIRSPMAISLSEWYKRKRLNPEYFLRSAFWFTPNTLPVVGIDSVVAQDILFALQAVDGQGRGLADAWLRAVQCAQLAHDRLLRDLYDVDRNLSFWQRQLSAGGVWSHGAFMLLSRGPLSFAADVAGAANDLASRRLEVLKSSLKYLSGIALDHHHHHHQQWSQARSVVEAVDGQAVPPPSPSSEASHESATATDMMQQRILLLRNLRLRLARALAELTQAAGLLWVSDGLAAVAPRRLPNLAAATASSPTAAEPAMEGFAAAAAAVPAGRVLASSRLQGQSEQEGLAVEAVEDAVRRAVCGMRAAIERLLSYTARDPNDGIDSLPEQPHQLRTYPGASQTQRPLVVELQELLDLLRLQPPVKQALGLGLPLEPEPRPPAAAVTASSPQATGPPAAAGTSAGSIMSGDGSNGGSSSHPMGLHLTTGGCSAAAALGAARRAAALAGPLVQLPATARMPSRFQRHWLRYCAGAGLLLYGGIFLLRHSRLMGSEDMERWIRTAVSAVRSALRTHVAEPLAAVRDELFRTFRDRPSIVSPQDFTLSQDSLLRMLTDFAADHKAFSTTSSASTTDADATADGSSSSTSSSSNGITAAGGVGREIRQSLSTSQSSLKSSFPGLEGSGAVAAGGSQSGSGNGRSISEEDDKALAAGMAVLMRSYEAELRNPLRNLLLGDLARALLIQVQHVKVDGEAAMLRLDQILRANELSLSLMAALPALAISLAAALGLTRLLIPRAPDPKRAAVPSRLAMASLEVTLTQLAAADEQLPQHPPENTVAAVEELRGLAAYRLYRVYSEITALYATADRTSRYSEWRQLYADLLRLATPTQARERLAIHQRMMRTYTVFLR